MYDFCHAWGGPHPWQRPQIHADEKVRLPQSREEKGSGVTSPNPWAKIQKHRVTDQISKLKAAVLVLE